MPLLFPVAGCTWGCIGWGTVGHLGIGDQSADVVAVVSDKAGWGTEKCTNWPKSQRPPPTPNRSGVKGSQVGLSAPSMMVGAAASLGGRPRFGRSKCGAWIAAASAPARACENRWVTRTETQQQQASTTNMQHEASNGRQHAMAGKIQQYTSSTPVNMTAPNMHPRPTANNTSIQQ